MKILSVAAMALLVALLGCSSPMEAPPPTQDTDIAVETAVAEGLPTAMPTAPPDPTAVPSPTLKPTPIPTPVVPPTPADLVRRVEDGVVRVTAGRKGGSGFIFDTEENTAFVVTAHHVIEDEDAIDVRVKNTKTYKATLLGYDADKDVAVLSICCSSAFNALAWDSGASADVGEQIVAVGYPRSSSPQVIATIGEIKDDPRGTPRGFIAHDAPLNPGNSGSPLFSKEGKVLGINTAISTTKEGIGYAVPYSVVADKVADWKSRLIVAGEPWPTPTPTPSPTPIPTHTPESPDSVASDRAALIAFFNATGGRRGYWTYKWLTDAPLGEWHGVGTDSEGRVVALSIAGMGLRGELPPELGRLSRLRHLSLWGNRLSGQIPPELNNLSNLRGLYLAGGTEPQVNQFNGCIPDGFRFVPYSDLERLHLPFCTLSINSNEDRGALVALYQATDGLNWDNSDNWLSRTRPLEEWYGVTTDLNGRVIKLDLRHNNLSGEIPQELGALTSLKVLDLKFHQLTGKIPPELGNLSSLQYLELFSSYGGESGLTGKIPAEMANLANLIDMDLSGNLLTGEIPPELGNLSNLEQLDLSSNKLIGEIPPELGDLSNLERLDLSSNRLIGEVPPELGNLHNLKSLVIRRNELGGHIPPELGRLSNLRALNLELNRLTGEIPSELGDLPTLDFLKIARGNRFTGCIPRELRDVRTNDLEELDLPFC